MVTRITSTSVSSSLTNRINSSYANYAKITEQLSTGNKINSLMDDSIQFINITNSTRRLNQIGTWTANVKALNNEVKESSDVIDKAISKAQRAKDLAANAATGTSSQDTLGSILTELDGIIATIVDMANTNYNGNYIYSGANTTTPAYEIQYGVDDDGNPTKEIVGIKYNGTAMTDDWQRQLEIADGLFQNCNLTGIEVFGEHNVTEDVDANGDTVYTVENSTGLMGDLISLRNAIKDTIDALDARDALADGADEDERQAANDAVTDGYSSINGLLDKFSLSIEKMTTCNATLGTVSNKLDMSEDSLTGSKDSLTEFISGIRDIDVTQTISDWYNSQYAYQASMQASLSAMQLNLLNYLS